MRGFADIKYASLANTCMYDKHDNIENKSSIVLIDSRFFNILWTVDFLLLGLLLELLQFNTL